MVKRRITIGWIKPKFFGLDNMACRVVVEIEIEKRFCTQKDLWLKEVKNPERLSICGDIYYGKKWFQGGQINNVIRNALEQNAFMRLKIPRESLEKLLEIWEEWHLNDLRAYCIHQKPIIQRIKKETPELLASGLERYKKLKQIPELKQCPECGYEYGSAWLYEPIPKEVKKFLTSLGRKR